MTSRIEDYLEALLAGESTGLPVPQSRLEMFLDALLRGGTEYPVPQSRTEVYLAALIEQGGTSGGGGTGGNAEAQLAEMCALTLTEFVNSTVTEIKIRAFTYNKNLKKIYCPNLTTMDCSFMATDCTSLTEIHLPLVSYWGGQSLFEGCTALTEVAFPSLSFVGNSGFARCTALTKVDLGTNGVAHTARELLNGAFRGCSNLTTLILRNTRLCTVPNIAAFTGSAFAEGGKGGTVYVPAALIESYKTATNWSTLYAAGTCNFVAIEGSEYE